MVGGPGRALATVEPGGRATTRNCLANPRFQPAGVRICVRTFARRWACPDGARRTQAALSSNGRPQGRGPSTPFNPDSRDADAAVPQGKAILLALLFGDRRYLTQDTLDNFSAATLTHSLALSGQHLAVAGLVGLLCVLAAGPACVLACTYASRAPY